MSRLRTTLEARGNSPVVLREQGNVGADDILRQAIQFSDAITTRGACRIFSLDDDPATLLALLVVAESFPVSLVLGRASAGDVKLPEELEPDVVVRDSGEIVPGSHYSRDRQTGCAPGIYLLTSGTTGRPKVVHQTLEALTARMRRESLEKNRGGIWLLTYEPHSFAGLQVVLSAALSEGALVMGHGRTATEICRLARTFRVSHLSGTPTFWRSLLMAVDSEGLPSLRQITLGGEAADQGTLDRLQRAFPQARVTHIYASTEAGALFAVNDGRAGFPAAWLGEELPGGVRLRIREGMLEVQARSLMQRYAGSHPAPLTEDGWLRTGDLVEVVEDRVLFRGRDDEVINVAGLKVFPREVEAYLLAHPHVREARVLAIPNPMTGAVLGAEIVPAAGAPDNLAQELLRACLRDLPAHKVPRRFAMVERIPISSSWKKVAPR
ncbi:MAG: fatty acid--CoA ligase family protein [Bryobacterales bacterium]|nr:fatty acid--CoA ligase family protein [Bryobacteraceae bacterium]MDW8354768.1 fatty acid--CoA ligase family protein [Bryobacterales bacterium]